jgi:clan AA aspartic protease
MGLTYVEVVIANPADPSRSQDVTLLVDTGALFSIVPAILLRALGIPPQASRILQLADGSRVSRDLGEARFRLGGEEATSRVVFGEPGDAAVLGAVTLESLTLAVDPATGALRPMETLLAVGFRIPDDPAHG